MKKRIEYHLEGPDRRTGEYRLQLTYMSHFGPDFGNEGYRFVSPRGTGRIFSAHGGGVCAEWEDEKMAVGLPETPFPQAVSFDGRDLDTVAGIVRLFEEYNTFEFPDKIHTYRFPVRLECVGVLEIQTTELYSDLARKTLYEEIKKGVRRPENLPFKGVSLTVEDKNQWLLAGEQNT